ncbi:MAG: DUF1704 domain-containing protein, partial [Marinobacter sp.]
PVLDGVAAARRRLRPGTVVDDWLEREARSLESTALMLASVGTPAFHAYSRQLYGVPDQPPEKAGQGPCVRPAQSGTGAL